MEIEHINSDAVHIYARINGKSSKQIDAVMRGHGWRWNSDKKAWIRGNNQDGIKSLATVARLLQDY